MATWAWILIVVAIAVIAAVLITMAMRQRRTTMLRQRFGPEYEHTVQESDDRREAEADLRDRQKERNRLDIRPLAESARARFAADWREIQERFVDQPSNAVVAADGLVYRVMADRGYPMENFEAQAKLISVDHPAVVENYRYAHRVCERAQSEQASTEDLRGALLRYRSLFDELLQSDDADRAADTTGRVRHGANPSDNHQQSTERGAR
jgi:hypothetical protein